ncbi:hypothetical protein [Fructobacillus fructosus]|nr:hypothetical protein [Fructobacillus fructosus]
MNETESLGVRAAVERALASQTRWIIGSQIVLVFVVMVIVKLVLK